jgi:protein-L-isoaspartate(D-aspartate) O-methyltransferase
MTGPDDGFGRMREDLVAVLRKSGALHDERVARALLRVPRHLFVPHVRPDMAYRDIAIPTRWRGCLPASSSSQPAIVAIMLEELRPKPGQRILEIGAGSGYNAALLQELVGPEGRVVTVDISPDVVAWARSSLQAAGYRAPLVLEADGGCGYEPEAPYDRIIVTASSDEIPLPWFQQLRDGGVLVLPFRLNVPHFAVALRKEGAGFVSERISPSGFMRLRGAFGSSGTRVGLIRDITVAFDYRGPLLDPRALGRLLTTVPRQASLPQLPGRDEPDLWAFHYFAAFQGVPLAMLSTRNPGHGFTDAWGVADTRAGSATLFTAELAKKREVLVYGTGATLDGVREAVDRWAALGRPQPGRIRLRLTPLPQPRRARGQTIGRDEVCTRYWRVGATYGTA